MYLRVRPPQALQRPFATDAKDRGSPNFNALLLDAGWWSSRGPSTTATIESQSEAAEQICQVAQLSARLLQGHDVCVVTHGATGSGKSHLLLGPAFCTPSVDAATPEHLPLFPALVDNHGRVADTCAPVYAPNNPPQATQNGVLQHCVSELLSRDETVLKGSGNQVRLHLSAAYFTPGGWLDLLAGKDDSPILAVLEEAAQHVVPSMAALHGLLCTAFTRRATLDGLGETSPIRGHLALQLRVSCVETGATATALCLDPCAAPKKPAQPDSRASLFYSHTDFALRSALLGTLSECRPLVRAWVGPWEALLRRRICSTRSTSVLFTIPPSAEMDSEDVGVLLFADQLRGTQPQSCISPHTSSSYDTTLVSRPSTGPCTQQSQQQQPQRAAHSRLVPLDDCVVTDILSPAYESGMLGTPPCSGLECAPAPSPVHERADGWTQADCRVSAARRKDTSPIERQATESPPSITELSGQNRAFSLPHGTPPRMTRRACTPIASAATSEVDPATHTPGKRMKTVRKKVKKRRARSAAPLPAAAVYARQALSAGPRASAEAVPSEGHPPARLVEEEEARFRLILEEGERRAWDLLASGFQMPLRRRSSAAPMTTFPSALVGSVRSATRASVTLLSSPARSSTSITSQSLTPVSSKYRALAPLTPPSRASLSASSSVAGFDASHRHSHPVSPLLGADAEAHTRARACPPLSGFTAPSLLVGPPREKLTALSPSFGKSSLRASSPQRTLSARSHAAVDDSVHRRLTQSTASAPPFTPSPQKGTSYHDVTPSPRAASGRWRSSIFIDGGLDLKDFKPSPARRQSCVSFTDADRILPVVMEVHREITAQDHLMAAELMGRSEVELTEEQRRRTLESRFVAARTGRGGAHSKREAVPSPSRRFFLI